MGETFRGIASSGPLVIAVGVAALAGLVSFLSPCVLPLVPGYLSYVTGMAGADLNDALHRPTNAARGRIVLGTAGFIAGFTAVFVATTVLLARVGLSLSANERTVQVVVGILIVVMGLVFLGLVPGAYREFRIHKLPSAGLASAPVLGVVFGLSWSPCTGPTLGAVLALSQVQGSMARAVTLTIAYCLGLGLPFLIFGLGFRKLIGLHKAVRRNSVWVTRLGGAMLIVVGLALATGGWDLFINWLRAAVGPVSVSI
jgi:cytochrome c-type biogenesis protein